MNRNPKEKPCRLYLRVSPQEKKKITELAESCGIPVAEYLRKRALGYAVKAVVPDAFYVFNEKLSAAVSISGDNSRLSSSLNFSLKT